MFWFDFSWSIQDFLVRHWLLINIFLIIFLGILIYLSFKKPIWAIFLVLSILPFSYLLRSYINWRNFFGIPLEKIPFTFLELCILIIFLGFLIKNRFKLQVKCYPSTSLRAGKLQITSYKWPIILILIAATVSVFIAPNLKVAVGLWKAYFLEPILFFLVLINTLKSQKDKEIILWALGISTLWISLLAIFQKFTGWGIAEPIWLSETNRRVTAFYTSPNAVGLYLGPIIIIYLGWFLANLRRLWSSKFQSALIQLKDWGQIILKLIILILALLAIIFTFSQGTWLGLLTGILFLTFWGISKKWTVATLVFLILIISLIPVSQKKILPIITFQDQAGQNRLVLWQGSLNYLFDSPKNFLFGTGIFGFSQIQEKFRQPIEMEPLIYPHNIILNFWLELGLLGLISFIWLIIKFFKQGFTSYKLQVTGYRLLTLGLMAAIVTIIIHGLVDVPYFKNDLAVLFWVILGLMVI